MKRESRYMVKDKNLIFGENLKRTIREQGMNQTEFARKIGINHVTLSRYVSGINSPKPDYLKRIVDALGVTVEYLYSVEEGE